MKRGNFFLISQEKNKKLDDSDKPILLVEGLATGLTVYRASDYLDTVVCFDANNLISVTKNIKEKYPNKKIILMADDDEKTVSNAQSKGKNAINTGLSTAYKIQMLYSDIHIFIPSLTREEKVVKGLSDFNDLEKIRGKDFVKKEILNKIDDLKLNYLQKLKFS